MIPETPSLPDELKQAYDEGNLVVFIRAGVSRLAGYQSYLITLASSSKQNS